MSRDIGTHELKGVLVDWAKLEDDVRKLLGLAPYNGPDNIVRNDNYFYRYLIDTYGERPVKIATAKLQAEEKI